MRPSCAAKCLRRIATIASTLPLLRAKSRDLPEKNARGPVSQLFSFVDKLSLGSHPHHSLSKSQVE
jgi:hypothetical protein